MVKIFRIIINWQSAQWSALYSPAGFGDRLNENAQAWINKIKRSIEPDNATVSSLGVAFAPYCDDHEYLKTATFVTIAFLTLWFTDWGYLAFRTRDDSNDLTALTQEMWMLFLMIAFFVENDIETSRCAYHYNPRLHHSIFFYMHDYLQRHAFAPSPATSCVPA